MQKTGLKTFVYSFSVSLFAIFTANGIYWHNHTSQASDIKLPTKNITLFLKNEVANPSQINAPVKKIALSVLPEIKQEIPSLISEDEIIMADDIKLPEIPLEFSVVSLEEPLDDVTASSKMTEDTSLRQEITKHKLEREKADKVIIPLQIPEKAQTFASNKKEPTLASRSITPQASSMSGKKNDSILIVADNSLQGKESTSLPKPKALATQGEPLQLLLPLEKGAAPAIPTKNIIKTAATDGLDQVALADKSIPIQSMEKLSSTTSEPLSGSPTPSWEKMAEKKNNTSSPWVVAQADGALKNKKMAEETFYPKNDTQIKEALAPNLSNTKGVKIASETVKNLLIPIPEDILNDENLTPQLSYSPKVSQEEANSKKETALSEAPASQAPSEEIPTTDHAAKIKDTKKPDLLASLDAIFRANATKQEKKPSKPSAITNVKQKKQKSSLGKIMPTEMRLSFQPNRAEISGQTLRWIQAFATKAAESNNMAIEIRIDGTGAMDLQQKRLNLLHNILADKGVEYSKINTVFTQREPNSFIIKTITLNNLKGTRGNINKATNGYYIQW